MTMRPTTQAERARIVRTRLVAAGERGATTREIKQWLRDAGYTPPRNTSAWLDRIGGVYFTTADHGTRRHWFRDRRLEPRT